ncbi:exodeoxyribonuclease III [Aquipluma nitroreducens]|uniref:Exodeoxyribonuclease III n=1 Tax=Aquipluma nitroreducens TaxID=2010828 RepID=A0A5K7S9K4_9BACT|nr:exodeoxyribonuclease III [Aquipluma nitroreducens]BBE18149.1 exodeoxyribonuclease III [Aquipluma nitroreducens]
MKRILSYNVNGIRSAIGKGLFDFLVEVNPDIVCFQETKAQLGQMHELEFEKLGYHPFAFSAEKRGYSGVAIFSKLEPDLVVYGMNNEKYDSEGRVIRADFGDISVISVYFPSGTTGGNRQAFKMDFLSDFQNYLTELRKTRSKLIISGDYNICRLWIDIHNPEKQQDTSGFLPEEREWFANFVEDGYVDSFREFNQEKHQFSWWSYRAGARQNNKGWRIDYHMITSNLKDKLVNAKILPMAVHSDHCPVLVDVDF